MAEILRNGSNPKIYRNGIVYSDSGGGSATLITKSISTNGTYNASSDNADGYSQVTVAVPLTTKSIITNGTYNASDDNADGYSQVVVDVPPLPPALGGNTKDGFLMQHSVKELGKFYAQSSSVMSLSYNNDKDLVFNYVSGANIGASWNGNVDISGNGFTKLKFKFVATTSYDYQHSGNSRPFIIGIANGIKTSYINVNATTVGNVFRLYKMYLPQQYSTATVTDELDISGITGNENYLAVVAHGWSVTANFSLE